MSKYATQLLFIIFFIVCCFTKGLGRSPQIDPVRFTLTTNATHVSLNQEIEIRINAEYLNISPAVAYVLDGANSFRLKVVVPEGFVKTGGTYYDYIGGNLTKSKPKITYTIKGKFTSSSGNKIFELLRSNADADKQSIFVAVGRLTFNDEGNDTKKGEEVFTRIASVAPTYLPYMTMGELRMYSPDTLKAVFINEGDRSGMFIYDSTSTDLDDSALTLVTTTSKRYRRVFGGQVNVKWFGAKGDGVTDDTDAIKAAMQKFGSGVYLPEGTFLISSPLPFFSSITGSSNSMTIIQADSTFSGKSMIDNNAGDHRKSIVNIRLDANNLPGVQHLGSSGDAQGSSGTKYENIYFYNSDKATYSIGGSSTTAVPGMLTGANFYNCQWRNVGKVMKLGNNQDDVSFIGCRFGLDRSDSTTDRPFVVGVGSNHRFQGCYFYIKDVGPTLGVNTVFGIGGNLTIFENNFIESPSTSNVTHLFHLTDPGANLVIKGLHLNIDAATPLVALIRAQVESGSQPIRDIEVSSLGKSIQFPLNVKLLDLYVATANDKKINLTFEHADILASPYQIASGGMSNANRILSLRGQMLGISYDNWATTSGVLENSSTNIVGMEGLVSNFTTTISSAAPSPQIGTFTLPSRGTYLVTITARLDSNRDHMFSGTYLINYYNGANDMLATELLGSVQKSAGSAWGLSTMVVSNPTEAGVISVTASWSAGATHTLFLVVNTRKLSSF